MSLLEKYVLIQENEALRFARECFIRVGVPREDADIIADHLVLASLRGVDSHGLIRIPYYIEGIKRGLVKPSPEIKILSQNPSHAMIDGGGGLGIPIAVRATKLSLEKARRSGISAVGVRNLGHVGMLAYYTLMAIREGIIGIVMANSPAIVAPWGGVDRIFGTNPISIGFPGQRGKGIVIDMATSAIAHFKIKLAAMRGERIPEGAALNREGRPTTDPKEALEGVLLPFGGYKGYALSLAVEMLSSILLGAPSSTEIPSHPSTQGGFLIISIDVGSFRSYSDYLEDLDRLINKIKRSRKAQGYQEILLPGEPEEREETKRRSMGIPIDMETWNLLLKTAEELNVAPPRIFGKTG